MNRQLNDCPYKKINNEIAVFDASPHQLVSLLYSGLLQQLSIAKGCIVRFDIEAKCIAINKSIRILGGLCEYVNEDIETSSIGKNLIELYCYMIRRLSEANSTDDEKIIDEVINLILPIKESWLNINPRPKNIIN